MKRSSNLEEEDAQHEDADQHIQRDAELDHQRHAVGGAGSGKEQAVFHRQEADHLRNRIAPGDHHQESEQHAGHRNPQRRAHHRAGQLGDRQSQVEGKNHQSDTDQHGGWNVDHWFDVTIDIQLLHQPVEEPRHRNHLQHQRQRRRVIQVMLTGGPADDGGGQCQRRTLPGKQRHQTDDAALGKHRERNQQQQRSQQVDDLQVIGQRHVRPPSRARRAHPGKWCARRTLRMAISDLQQKMNQHAEHRQQKRGTEIFRHPEQAQLGADGFHEGEQETTAGHLGEKRQHRQR